MDEYGAAPMPDEFAALADASEVMRETLALVGDLRQATMRLGDALVDAGLPARDWRDDDAWLDLLSERLPAISLDDFLTELARFAADEGPNLLHGDARDIAAFGDTLTQYHESARTLRVVAQRLRLAGAHERGAELPLAEALASLRVSAPLDRLTTTLRDLESLQPFLAPLSRREWDALNRPPVAPAPPPAPERPSGRLAPPSPATERPSGQLSPQPPPERPSGRLAASAPEPTSSGRLRSQPAPESPPWPRRAYANGQAGADVADETTRPITPQEARQATQGFSRLRDFAPTQEVEATSLGARVGGRPAPLAGRPGALVAHLPVGMRPPVVWAFRHRLLTTAVMIVALASAVGLTAYLASAQAARPPAPAVSRLTFSPARLTLACSGAATQFTLSDPARAPTATPNAHASAQATRAAPTSKATSKPVATPTPITIEWRAPTGGPLVVAPTHGALTPGAHATLTVRMAPGPATKTATTAKTSTAKGAANANTPTPRSIQGTLTLTASDGVVSIPWVETC